MKSCNRVWLLQYVNFVFQCQLLGTTIEGSPGCCACWGCWGSAAQAQQSEHLGFSSGNACPARLSVGRSGFQEALDELTTSSSPLTQPEFHCQTVFISGFRNCVQLWRAMLMWFTRNNWALSPAFSWLSSLPHPALHFYLLSVLPRSVLWYIKKAQKCLSLWGPCRCTPTVPH